MIAPARVSPRPPRWVRRFCAVALMAAIAIVAAAGCTADDMMGGSVATKSYGPVPPLPSTQPGSPRVPSSFPKGIPIVAGLYREGVGMSSESKTLEVTDVQPDAEQEAAKLLVDAGYIEQSFVGQKAFLGTKYMVMVSGDSLGGPFVLVYTVMPTTGMPGIPAFPTSLPRIF